MPLPTLLQKGHLIPVNDDPKSSLDNFIPIEYIMEWIKTRIPKSGVESRVLILRSDTASGKTTILPPFLYKNFFEAKKGNIIITQPKVLLAISNAKEVSKIPDNTFMKIGETIGWQTGISKKRIKEGVLFMTIGVLTIVLKKYTDEEIMDMYRFIILDEVHELSIEMTQALYLLKKFVIRNAGNPKLPFVICTSATLDVDMFLRYFDVPKLTNCIVVEGFAYPKTTHWLEKNADNYITGCYENVVKIHPNDDPPDLGDILIFLPGAGEMKKINKMLDTYNAELVKEKPPRVFKVFSIDSNAVASNSSDYLSLSYKTSSLKVVVEGKSYTPVRRIILSTNVAETGLTIDTLKYVIDSGYNRSTEYYPSVNATGLLTKPITHSRLKQRMGRAGRKFPGEFWPVYTEDTYNLMEKQQFSDIVLNDFSQVLLNIMDMEGDNFTVTNLDLVESVSPEAIHSSMERCFVLGYYSANEKKITPLGKLANKFYMLPLEISRMILGGYFWDVSIIDLITIASYLLIDTRNFDAPMKMGGDDTGDDSDESDDNSKSDNESDDDISDNLLNNNHEVMHLRKDESDNSDNESDNITGGFSLKKMQKHRDKSRSKSRDKFRDYTPTVIDWIKIYQEGAPDFMTSDAIFKMKTLISDEFINGLFLYRAVCKMIAKGNDNFYTGLVKWCEECNISFKGIMEFIKTRDGLIEQLSSNGFVIFDGKSSVLDQPIENFMNEIIKIKYCIYDGFKLNILKLNLQTHKYESSMGEVITPKIFSQDELNISIHKKYGISNITLPKYILYDKLTLKYNKNTMLYDITANRVSSVDGIIIDIYE